MGEYTEMELWVKIQGSERLEMVFSCVSGFSGNRLFASARSRVLNESWYSNAAVS
jgi:hypothetical protein